MQHFGAGRPCPYAVTPCLALSRHETPVYYGPDCPKRRALLKELAADKKSTGVTTVICFGGKIVENDGKVLIEGRAIEAESDLTGVPAPSDEDCRRFRPEDAQPLPEIPDSSVVEEPTQPPPSTTSSFELPDNFPGV